MYIVRAGKKKEGIVYKTNSVWAWKPECGIYPQKFHANQDLSHVKRYLEYTFPEKKIQFERLTKPIY